MSPEATQLVNSLLDTCVPYDGFHKENRRALDVLIEYIERLEADAARYRWWRGDYLNDEGTYPVNYLENLQTATTPDEVDAAIDLGMQSR